MANTVSDFAYSLFRTTGQFYKALISRPTETIKRMTIAATTDVAVIPSKGNPHTVTIRNLSAVDLRFSHDELSASSTEYLTLLAGEERKFEYHISGYEYRMVGDVLYQKAIFHCEWSDAMHIFNPSGTSAVVEVLVIG